MDQRGHGLSDHSADYWRDAFVQDIAGLLDHLGASDPVVLIGNSLGGTNAFCFAARYPTRVRAMVIEEGPPEGHGSFEFVLEWRGLYPTRQALEQKIGERLAWSVAPSFRETAHRIHEAMTLSFRLFKHVESPDVDALSLLAQVRLRVNLGQKVVNRLGHFGTGVVIRVESR
jgi:pimeloyl-ACP methyl ester carboxylesterase